MAKRTLIELNTACKCFFKDGTTRDFSSIEEASKETGLSVAAIKIRANKGTPNKKDGISFKWTDEHTRRSYQARKSRNKGHGYELQVIKELTELGYKGLVSSRSQSKRLDNAKIDIAETEDRLDFYIQCKATANIPSISNINKECGFKDRPLAIFWKKQENTNKQEEYVIIPKSYFYTLVKK